MLTITSAFLVLSLPITTSLFGVIYTTESQLLDCTNSTEPSICSNQIIKSKNRTSSRTINKYHASSTHRRDISEVCANNQKLGGPSLICSPKSSLNSSTENHHEARKPVEVFIKTPNNATQFDQGASLTIECAQSNQSIASTETDSPLTIIAATTRLWTAQRNGGLDLELNNYQEEDAGNYFCQALTSDTGEIISEAHIRLTLNQFPSKGSDESEGNDLLTYNLYTQKHLFSLLPSLKVMPQFAEVQVGETIQLVCYTSHLDPDPDPSTIEWSFEAIESRKQLLHRPPTVAVELPYNVSTLGNVLIVWSMNEEHCGIYKCTVRLADFNLSVQAAGELVLRPTSESAPLVFVSPGIVRLSPNGSARIQCEATGYPPPKVVWYRIEAAYSEMQNNFSSGGDTSLPDMDGIVFEQIAYEDAILYCEQNRCQSPANHRSYITSISLIHLKHARAEHQGQWVCRASNKHGSNQASSIIDVEFREPPIVVIPAEFREQTIVLSSDSIYQKQQNATFKCSIKSGKPQPKLHWLRTVTATGGNINTQLSTSNNLDIYDLTRVISATSNVSVHLEDRGKSLVLVVGTISLDDEGDYVCLGENDWGRNSAVAHLTVRQPASIRILQSSPMIVRPNDSFHLDCLAKGHPAPLDIEWSRYDRGAFFSLISRSSSASSPSGSHERAMLKFDRVSVEDSGEYTCNARDPLNGSLILRDTIMVLVENGSTYPVHPSQQISRAQDAFLPRLMVRPTKVAAALGSNVTLDCLAVSGLQPTVVEWSGPPAELSTKLANNQTISDGGHIWPYYRADLPEAGQLVQFGSKLRILNVSKHHEGVYQCKGTNRAGVENAPALIRVLEPEVGERPEGMGDWPAESFVTKTKVAKVGSNIELKCQVSGVAQPATSWSRDGLELPPSSVQIEHNLWIQNVSQRDSGLYICSARSKQPNKVIQAKINLLVSGELDNGLLGDGGRVHNLTAKIVASKNAVNLGDSITLECIVTIPQGSSLLGKGNMNSLSGGGNQPTLMKPDDLEEIERNVIWTNTHSGQSVFQDNVYIQHNLLIIYDLKPENSATYRCNYNDFTQHTDYRLQVTDSNEPTASLNPLIGHDPTRGVAGETMLVGSAYSAQIKQVALGSQLILECPPMSGKGSSGGGGYRWTRGEGHRQRAVGSESAPLVLETIRTSEADIYHCYYIDHTQPPKITSFVVHVLVPVARFVQRPVSFVSLPSISGANQQLEIELKFLPERDSGLILFNGQRQWNRSSVGDYISLGLNRGFLEFRFELGDGTTLLRSIQSLALNQWHRVLIERNRRGAVMWLDKQPPVSNSSNGKFFNLNLDSVLYVGGNQYFLNKSRAGTGNNQTVGRFYGYSRGFQGCVSLLRIGHNEINLIARNRSASVGIYECDKPECLDSECGKGICQVDRTLASAAVLDPEQRRVTTPFELSADHRCICPPGSSGEHCELQLPANMIINFERQPPPPPVTTTTTTATSRSSTLQTSVTTPASEPPSNTAMATNPKSAAGACELLNLPCSTNGTQTCQSLTSTSFKCHCRLGFTGDTCSQVAQFSSETSLWFNQQAYLQFRFNRPEEAQLYNNEHPANESSNSSTRQQTANLTNFSRLSSMAESQSISFNLQTKSSYGLIFYMGQATKPFADSPNATNGSGALLADPLMSQTSKSMVANLLARLSSIVFDYLAIALVDGHVELSYELGSGVAIIRSSERVNDGSQHHLSVSRNGRSARLTIDNLHKHEGKSPGKLSMLNSPPDIYLGGLPNLAELTHNMYMSGFVGCVSSLQINSLGPINLIHSDHLSQVRSARNLAPCPAVAAANGSGEGTSRATQATSATAPPISSTLIPTKHKPYQAPEQPESEDPDEM